MRVWLAALTLAIFPFDVVAQGYVRCVQSQLTYIGFNPGPVDNILGAATRRAALSAQMVDLPSLTKKTAFDWCRHLGLSNRALQQFWPSEADDVLWLPDELRETAAEQLMRMAQVEALRLFSDTYGQRLVGGFAIFAGDEPGSLERASEAFRRGKSETWDGLYRNEPMPCGLDGGVRAIAFRDMLLMCWEKPVQYNSSWLKRHRDWFTRVFIHEYMHALQNELVGVDAQFWLPSGEWALGPTWLVEGSAEVIEGEWWAGETGLSEISLGKHARRARASNTSLSELHDSVTAQADYDLSEYAAFLLGERFGRDAYFMYFESVRTEGSYTAAFEQTYGMSLAAFEASFEEMRESVVLAHSFAKGENLP